MAKIIAVVNQKGGVGKTTTSVNLTAALTDLGKKVLLCDFDPQANATSGLGLDKRSLKHSIYDVLIQEVSAKEAITTTKFGDVLPATTDLAGAAVELISIEKPNSRLKEVLEPIKDNYDVILIDCPPSLEMLTLNALTAAEGILVPVQCEYYALEGLGQLLNTIKLVKKHLNKNIEVEGALLTMFDTRTNLSKQVVDEVKGYFGDKVYKTVIPRNIKLSEAPSYGVPITIYDARSKGAKCYDKLGKELISNNEQSKAKHMK